MRMLEVIVMVGAVVCALLIFWAVAAATACRGERRVAGERRRSSRDANLALNEALRTLEATNRGMESAITALEAGHRRLETNLAAERSRLDRLQGAVAEVDAAGWTNERAAGLRALAAEIERDRR